MKLAVVKYVATRVSDYVINKLKLLYSDMNIERKLSRQETNMYSFYNDRCAQKLGKSTCTYAKKTKYENNDIIRNENANYCF